VNYNVPEGGYSTDPYKPEVRIREFKQMVQALHRAGIKVILDVVYNHTWNIEGSNFQRTRPD
jgi:pullulanase